MGRRFQRGIVAGLVVLAGCRAPDDTAPPVAEQVPRDTAAGEAGTPRLRGTPPDVRLELPERFTRALAAEDPEFTTLTLPDLDPAITRLTSGWSYPWAGGQVPIALLGDFDGDGAGDVALLQKSEAGGRAVAVLDTKPAPTVHVLHAWTREALGETGPTAFYLVRYPAGRHAVPDFGGNRGPGADSVVVLPHEGITVAYFGKAATTHYYKDARFERMTTAD